MALILWILRLRRTCRSLPLCIQICACTIRTSSSHVHAVDAISCGCSDQFAILSAGLSFLRCMTGQWDDVYVSETANGSSSCFAPCSHLSVFAWMKMGFTAWKNLTPVRPHRSTLGQSKITIKIIMLTNIAAEVDEVQSLQSSLILVFVQATYPVPNSHILRTVSRKAAPITSPKSGPSA